MGKGSEKSKKNERYIVVVEVHERKGGQCHHRNWREKQKTAACGHMHSLSLERVKNERYIAVVEVCECERKRVLGGA